MQQVIFGIEEHDRALLCADGVIEQRIAIETAEHPVSLSIYAETQSDLVTILELNELNLGNSAYVEADSFPA